MQTVLISKIHLTVITCVHVCVRERHTVIYIYIRLQIYTNTIIAVLRKIFSIVMISPPWVLR